VNLEVSIVGTSLVAIKNDLDGFSQSGWIVTGYLISYTGESTESRRKLRALSNY
jgi:hypothetical protein